MHLQEEWWWWWCHDYCNYLWSTRGVEGMPVHAVREFLRPSGLWKCIHPSRVGQQMHRMPEERFRIYWSAAERERGGRLESIKRNSLDASEGVECNKSPFIKRHRSIICGFCANLSFTAHYLFVLQLLAVERLGKKNARTRAVLYQSGSSSASPLLVLCSCCNYNRVNSFLFFSFVFFL